MLKTIWTKLILLLEKYIKQCVFDNKKLRGSYLYFFHPEAMSLLVLRVILKTKIIFPSVTLKIIKSAIRTLNSLYIT